MTPEESRIVARIEEEREHLRQRFLDANFVAKAALWVLSISMTIHAAVLFSWCTGG